MTARTRICLALLVVANGCGRAHFDVRPDGPDLDGENAEGGDVPSIAVCDVEAPFAPPVLVAGVNDAAAYDSTFIPTSDELRAYFYSNRGGNFDIYEATRSALEDAWTVRRVDELASPRSEKEPSLSPDGSILAFVSNRDPNVGNDDFWYATYDGTRFTVAGPIAAFNTVETDYHPLFQGANDTFWFSSDIAGTVSIYSASYAGTTFGPATLRDDLDVAGANSSAAAPSPDGLTVYFRSDRGIGGSYDIYIAHRTSRDAAFGSARPVTELNTVALDTPNWISPDGCRLYLSNSLEGPSNIYVATKPFR